MRRMRQSLTVEEYERLHLDFYRVLFLQLTLACPLQCEHCCVSAAPSRTEFLDPDHVEVGIRDFASLPSAEVVALTGGEPFLAADALHRALAVAHEVGLRTYVITSASWASSERLARDTLDQLPPITLLAVSADRFHERFVPLSNVSNALKASLQREMDVALHVTVEADDDDYPQSVETRLGPIWLQANPRVTRLQPVGRARGRNLGQYPDCGPVPDGPCPMLGTPAVTADGSICACCQAQETNRIVTGAPHALRLGHLAFPRFPALTHRVATDPLLRAIRHVGPGWVFHRARERGIDLGPPQHFNTICDVCATLVRDVDKAAELSAMLIDDSLAAQVAVAEELGQHA